MSYRTGNPGHARLLRTCLEGISRSGDISVKFPFAEILVALALTLVVLAPSPDTGVPPTVEGDILDQANATYRKELAELLDLFGSRDFGDERVAAAWEAAWTKSFDATFQPVEDRVAKAAIGGQEPMRVLAEQLRHHELGKDQ